MNLAKQALNNLGASFSRDDLYHETLLLYRRALGIRDDVWQRTEPQDPDREENAYEAAEGHANMAALMMDLGRPRQAGPHFDRAINIMVGEFGEGHERNARWLVMRGSALRALGNYPYAALDVDRALGIYREIVRTAPPAVGGALANLGSIAAEWVDEDSTLTAERRMQLHEMAGGSLETALDGSEQMYGEEHPMTGGLLRALGAVREAQGAAAEARGYLERAEACRRLNLRGTDAEAAVAIDRAAQLLVDWGLWDEAQAYLERALAIREDVLGDQNFDTSSSLLKLAVRFQLTGRDGQARQHLEWALVVRVNICGETHPATDMVRENLRLLEG
ncbi:MAG: tetratricopeptide repeat protein [Actinomycetota bacterium]|nr:tetratricopeptide repeat protein [Actinomycetota bacterium]